MVQQACVKQVGFGGMRARRPATQDIPVKEYENFDHFVATGSVPSGRFTIQYENAPVDFFYAPVDYARTTVVFFHGSTDKAVSLPMHTGSGVMRNLPANRLAISDPSLTLDGSRKLILSWFAGSSRQPKLQYFIERVIRRIREVTGSQHMIFMGGSGGGFASLEMSRRFAGSLALAMNPQTNLTRYYVRLVHSYLDLCWDGALSLTALPKYVAHDLVEAYPDILNHTVAYVQNTRDKHHIENHQLPFFEKVGKSPHVYMFMAPWGDPMGKGHVAPPRELMHSVLQRLVLADGEWRTALTVLGFEEHSNAETVRRTVREANANLPTDHEADVM